MTDDDGKRVPNGDESIMKRLKTETREYHSKLEALPYFKELMEHGLPLECYVNQLRGLSILHGVLESEIAGSKDRRLLAVWSDDLRKLPLLKEDLSFFAPRVVPDAAAPVEAALAMAEKIRFRRVEKPFTLLGYLYVLEGSTLGNKMHRPDISATFHLEGLTGCRYYASYGEQVQNHWKAFSQTMNEALKEPALHDFILEAAHEAFSGLELLYTALYPLEKNDDKSFHITRINPEAGNHPMPQDSREIEAALSASNRGWSEFPYYEQRYGERGKRYSDSDACWLATLTTLDQALLQQQIDWLCRVLATRGMPTILMERILLFLCEELSSAVPERAAEYEKLRISAKTLRKKREKQASESLMESLAGEFEAAVKSETSVPCKNTGLLIVSAVADEKNGIAGAVNALKEWLTDSKRFSKGWVSAVQEAFNEAFQKMNETARNA